MHRLLEDLLANKTVRAVGLVVASALIVIVLKTLFRG